jgi:hypothetical protein
MHGIQGKISHDSNRGACDFGNGFYTGDNLEQSINRISNTGGGIIYQYGVDLSTLKTYKFTDDIDWALFVAVNRHKLNQSSFKRLDLLCKKLQSYDVIIGHIADDKIADILNDFIDNKIMDRCLIEGLKLIKYGDQYSFKTPKVCSSLILIDSYSLTSDDRKKSIEWGRMMKCNMQRDLAIIRERYEYTGFKIKELNYYYK